MFINICNVYFVTWISAVANLRGCEEGNISTTRVLVHFYEFLTRISLVCNYNIMYTLHEIG